MDKPALTFSPQVIVTALSRKHVVHLSTIAACIVVCRELHVLSSVSSSGIQCIDILMLGA